MKLVAFDLETTGLEPERDRILEFCFVELDDGLNEKGRWGRLVDPGVAVSPEIEELTGITTAMVRGQQPFAVHAPRVQALVKDAVLVAHNAAFDVSFLHMELVRAGQPGLAPDHPCIDTLAIERHVNSHRLAEVYRRYVGQPFDGGHRSEADVQATLEVLRRQRVAHAEKLPPGGLAALVTANVDRHFGGDQRVRNWLDHAHRLYRDPQGLVRFGFGPYRTCPVVQPHACPVDKVERHHEDFLRWMRGRDFNADTKAAIDMILGPGPAAKASRSSWPVPREAAPAPATDPLGLAMGGASGLPAVAPGAGSAAPA